jgi:hypothetical protein
LVVYVVWRKVELPEDAAGLTDRGEPTRESRQTGAPPELLREFAGLYSRKTALGMDLEKLEASRRRGKIKKREFMIRERDLKKQIGLPNLSYRKRRLKVPKLDSVSFCCERRNRG